MILPGHPYHLKSDAELHYILRDAYAASVAMRGHDAIAEAKYLDQVNDAASILHMRRQQRIGATE